jgi:hypothetical protein
MQNVFNVPDPIVLYIKVPSIYLWGISFAGVNLDRVTTVKFNPTGTLIFAGFEQVAPSLSLIFSVLNSTNGNLIKSLKVLSE